MTTYIIYDGYGNFFDVIEAANDAAFEKWNFETEKEGLQTLSMRVFTNARQTSYGRYNDLNIANQAQLKNVIEAYLYAKKLAGAQIERDGGTSCGVYHIEPFHTHWDKRTVEQVAGYVRLYIQSWILPKFTLYFNSIIKNK